ncbi:hypothetical protein KZZ52_22460 [Dactylosporangium sp. AC04546]|uniref:hypothetical protein n=1 Tax=Dactylosporangium sp. AC04546 TaxID=2862460 RepID=UPI001EDF59A3|nr:hypothetical protein [Dactylosporangium sp. AC04546]WVK88043.1 hypothetical protein KZZ52_22460 [Dactylosporangium sp. AC04546]
MSPRWHRPLLWFAAVMGLLTVVALVGLFTDDRQIVGSPAWLKPFKFAVSFGLYALTLAWLLKKAQRFRRTGWWAGTVVTVASLAEMVLIVLQAVRGRPSHFNNSTPFDETVWSLMGNLVVVLWTASLVVAVVIAVQRDGDPVVRSAARSGFALSLAGMAVAFLMTMPTDAQRAAVDAGTSTGFVGAHSVGVADGGPSMPVTGWSTTGGDLRIAHFVGIHALQALPLLALLLAGFVADQRVRLRLVRVAAAGYAGLIALLTWQALRGQPLLEPDRTTLLAAGVLTVLLVAAAAGTTVRRRELQIT